MQVGGEVLFQPNKNSMAREVGRVVSIDGEAVVIAWEGREYPQDRAKDFIREIL